MAGLEIDSMLATGSLPSAHRSSGIAGEIQRWERQSRGPPSAPVASSAAAAARRAAMPLRLAPATRSPRRGRENLRPRSQYSYKLFYY
eukprot:scaffold53635_cov35-Tisochrysis_lutea.AAC.1